MFGNKNNQQAAPDPAQQPAVDGFLPAHTATHADPMAAQQIHVSITPGTPPVVATEAADNNYIMTDAPAAAPAPAADVDTSTGGVNDLLALKQQALQQLSPLVSHLDQSPEDKFRTTMMMLQSTDDQNLVRVAYEAAQNIPDEKVRAQALLDVINEINYFTQKNSQEAK